MEPSLDDKNAQNKLAAMDLADKIYQVIMDKRFLDEVKDPNIRQKAIQSKYPNFSQVYPVVVRLMARDLKYNRSAFKRFLDRLEKDPGQGMEGFMTNQANYAKFLYLEITKKRHPNMKVANKIWRMEYDAMKSSHNKLIEEEEKAKNEFEEEKVANLEKKRKELLDFLILEDEKVEPALDPVREDAERLKYGLPLKNPKPTFSNMDITNFTLDELMMLSREMRNYEDTLLTKLEQQDEIIDQLENSRQVKEEKFKKKVQTYNDWITGTSAEKEMKKRIRNQRKCKGCNADF